MSTFRTSNGSRAQHTPPRFQSQPYKLHPGRREHIYGKIQPMASPSKVRRQTLIVTAVILAVGLSAAIWIM